ncbi:MAG: hypothetical protein NT062_00280 [Proteobacteria bacterium]|nr:hypothetical protein [Pseudomonadota bacterium]
MFAAAITVGCSHAEPSPPATRAFYHWRTTLALSTTEQRALHDVGVTRLYVKVFDVAWQDDAPIVVGELAAGSTAPAGVEVVPVVFLRAEVFAHGPRHELAAATWARVERIAQRLAITPAELQLDCDWTDGTRDEFFAFVTDLRARVPRGLTLSATIRLHQIKYRERTGVPPVDRGMLMFYNMGKFSAASGDRAIFDEAIARQYVARIDDYPLPLDLALPIWSWTVHLRDDRVEGLMQSTPVETLEAQDFLQRREASTPGRFLVTRTTFLAGELLREGDELKVESIGPADALAAAKLVAPHLPRTTKARTISLFDLSDKNLRRHDRASLDQLFSSVR